MIYEKVNSQLEKRVNNAMPKAGGIFTGDVTAYSENRTSACLRNTEVRITNTEGELQSTNKIIMVRK